MAAEQKKKANRLKIDTPLPSHQEARVQGALTRALKKLGIYGQLSGNEMAHLQGFGRFEYRHGLEARGERVSPKYYELGKNNVTGFVLQNVARGKKYGPQKITQILEGISNEVRESFRKPVTRRRHGRPG